MSMLKSLIGAVAVIAVTSTGANALEFRFDRASFEISSGVQLTAKRLDGFTSRACNVYGFIGLNARQARESCKAKLTAEILDEISDNRLTAAMSSHAYVAGN